MGRDPFLSSPRWNLLPVVPAWPAAGAEGGLEAQAIGGALYPDGRAEGGVAANGLLQGLFLGPALRAVDHGKPVGRDLDRPLREDLPVLVAAGRPPPEAAPAPVLCPIDEAGAKRVALDIAADGEQVLVGLDGERFEPLTRGLSLRESDREAIPMPRVKGKRPWYRWPVPEV